MVEDSPSSISFRIGASWIIFPTTVACQVPLPLRVRNPHPRSFLQISATLRPSRYEVMIRSMVSCSDCSTTKRPSCDWQTHREEYRCRRRHYVSDRNLWNSKAIHDSIGFKIRMMKRDVVALEEVIKKTHFPERGNQDVLKRCNTGFRPPGRHWHASSALLTVLYDDCRTNRIKSASMEPKAVFQNLIEPFRNLIEPFRKVFERHCDLIEEFQNPLIDLENALKSFRIH